MQAGEKRNNIHTGRRIIYSALLISILLLGIMVGHRSGVEDAKINCDNCHAALTWCKDEMQKSRIGIVAEIEYKFNVSDLE